MSAGDTALGHERLRALVPPLDDARHKGQAGRIGVVGGCREYTGAPWFAAMSALRAGADLAHVFCTHDAAPVIKSYSPELIVHPCLPDSEMPRGPDVDTRFDAKSLAAGEVSSFFSRLDALVIGPGLGRDEAVLQVAESVLKDALDANLPLVLDGDGLFLVTRKPQLLTSRIPGGSGPLRVILTPNVNEYRRLCDALGMGETDPSDLEASQMSLARMSGQLGVRVNVKNISRLLTMCTEASQQGATIVRKGRVDLVAAGDAPVLVCAEPGAPRRCGGQGDVLAGTTAVMAAWAQRSAGSLQHAAVAASTLVRATAARTFAARKRSMVAGDLIPELGPTMEGIAPSTG